MSERCGLAYVVRHSLVTLLVSKKLVSNSLHLFSDRSDFNYAQWMYSRASRAFPFLMVIILVCLLRF